MKKILFVCLGNICRSPMAQLIFTQMASERGLSDMFAVDSFGTSDEEEGNHIYPPAARMLAAHGICGDHIAKRLTRVDANLADYIIVMDSGNLRATHAIAGAANAHKIRRLCDYTSRPHDIADPWYTRDFEKAYADIEEGCKAFLDELQKNI